MDDEIWFDEELLPPLELVEETARDLESLEEFHLGSADGVDVVSSRLALGRLAARQYVEDTARGVVRVHMPRWRPLTAEEASGLPTGLGDLEAGRLAHGKLCLVRLGMELDALPEGREEGWTYTTAWCRAFLFSPGGDVQPRLLDIYPQRLYEGEPATVKVEVGLGLKAGPVEAKAGKASTDLHMGQVSPVTVGFLGEEERSPYWELRAGKRSILGLYHFWMIVEQPPGCGPVRLKVLGAGDLQTRLFTIPVGPKVRAWDDRRESVALA